MPGPGPTSRAISFVIKILELSVFEICTKILYTPRMAFDAAQVSQQLFSSDQFLRYSYLFGLPMLHTGSFKYQGPLSQKKARENRSIVVKN